MKLLSPKLDIVFKKIFTEHLDLLQHFVASMISVPVESITRLEVINSELPPEDANAKFSRLDLRLWMNKTQINIEIQLKKTCGFKDRALFYWAKLYTSPLKSGESYSMLHKAISINILDFNLFEEVESPHTVIVPVIKCSNEIFSDKMQIHFFELKKIDKLHRDAAIDGSNSQPLMHTSMTPDMTNWLKFLNIQSMEDLDVFKNDQTLSKAALILTELSGDELVQEQARLREKRLHDEASYLADARAEGEARGITIGEARGEARGITIGEARAAEKEQTKTIKKLKRRGYSDEEIRTFLEEDSEN